VIVAARTQVIGTTNSLRIRDSPLTEIKIQQPLIGEQLMHRALRWLRHPSLKHALHEHTRDQAMIADAAFRFRSSHTKD
jgi:hypothetical protein